MPKSLTRSVLTTMSRCFLPMRKLSVAAAILSTSAQPLFADEQGVFLGTIVLQGEEAGYNPRSTTVAGRAPADVRDVPLSLSGIGRERLTGEMIADDIEAIGRSTGMNISGTPYASGITSRGFVTLNNVEGLRMTSEDSNFTPVIDGFLLGGIEILRGPAGILEGAGEPGGVVSRSFKRPLQFAAGHGGLSFGSYGMRRAEFDYGGPISADGRLRGRFAGATMEEGFERDVVSHERAAVFGALEYDLTPDTLVRISAMYQKDDRTPFWGVPSHEDGHLIDFDRSTYLGSDRGRFDTEYALVTAEITHAFANGWTVRVAANHFDQKIDEFDLMTISPVYNLGTAQMVDLGLNVNQDRERGQGVDVSFSGPFSAFGRDHRATIGFSYIGSRLQVDERWGYDAFPVDISNPVTDLPIPELADDGILQDRRYKQYGIYGQLNAGLTDSLTLSAGGRVSWAEMTSDITGPVLQDYRENAFFTPMLGLVWRADPFTSLYASVSDIHEPQFYRDAAGSPLAPMTGTQYEIGLKRDLSEGRLLFTAAVFDIERSNQAHRVGPWPSRVYRADGTTRSRGAELELSGDLGNGWGISAGYTYTDQKVTESRDLSRLGKRASNTPRHKAVLWLSHDFQGEALSGLSLATGITAASRIYDYGNSLSAPGFYTIDLAATYRVSETTELALKVNNVFDRNYYRSLGTSGMYHDQAEGRSIALQLRQRF
ncbi:TonB-dependent siderophore receptor [Rhodobacter sp. 24-YEA-8]|uniref:TonB-dependent siderophore receptor n=1 Tax=Rhodobacter sp. 24-YEA-8 TaxID=1884310 RepID=UPI00089AC67C|nr:TonB-dependent siderophore receptor [Rhodobacter sp. 24-YEA-8]SED18206.1 outer-membrane receptor for ferric coprogen and ferric-rhodotorulic acid [Rhodobacter sp. 24-YEA-8]